MARAISFIVLIGIIILISILFYQVMVGFFIPLFLAALLVVIFRPLHEKILGWCGARSHWAALLTTLAILVIVLVPTGLVFTVAAVQGTRAVAEVDVSTVNRALIRLRRSVGLEMPYAKHVRHLDSLVERLRVTQSPARLLPLVDEMQQALAALERERMADGPDAAGESGAADEAELVYGPPDDRVRAALAEFEQEIQQAFAAGERLNGEIAEEFAAVSATYSDFRQQLLGGPLRAELVEAANPREGDLEQLAKQALAAVPPRLVEATGATGGFLVKMIIGIVILIIAVYFFFADGPAMIRTLMKLSPLDDRYEHQLLNEFDRVSRAVLLAMVLTALVQGVLAAIGYWMAGLESVVLLMMLTTVMSLIPFLGAAAVWIPACLWLGLVESRWAAAGLLALWGGLVISTSDNFIKAAILHGRSRLHPLLALLSVLGGVAVFGPIGILVGPMTVVFLQTLLEIFNREVTEGMGSSARPLLGPAQRPPVTRLVRLASRGLPRNLR